MKINYIASTVFIGSIAAAIAGTVNLIYTQGHNNPGLIVLTIILGIYSFWGFCTVVGSADSHLRDLRELKAADTEIETAEAALVAIRELNSEATGLPEQLLALQQESNPVTKYMGMVQSAIGTVRDYKNRKADYAAKIQARAAGPLGLVVAFLGSSI